MRARTDCADVTRRACAIEVEIYAYRLLQIGVQTSSTTRPATIVLVFGSVTSNELDLYSLGDLLSSVSLGVAVAGSE